MWFRLGYPRSESPQTTKTLTLLEIPESTAPFGLPSHQTLTGTNCAGDYNDQCLGLVRSLGLAESHSANLRRDGRPRYVAHSSDIYSRVVEWCPSEYIEAPKIYFIFSTTDNGYRKIQDSEKFHMNFSYKNSNQILPQVFLRQVFWGLQLFVLSGLVGPSLSARYTRPMANLLPSAHSSQI